MDESKLKYKTNQTKTKAEFKASSRATINRKKSINHCHIYKGKELVIRSEFII